MLVQSCMTVKILLKYLLIFYLLVTTLIGDQNVEAPMAFN